MSKERRRHPRKPVDLPATISSQKQSEALQVRCINISLGGAQFAVDRKLEYGTSLEVTISVNDTEQVTIPAVSRWSDDSVVGVQFGSLRAKDAYKLAELVRSLPAEDDAPAA